jgi:deoxyribonuclease-4
MEPFDRTTLTRPLGRHLGTGPGHEQTIEAARRIGCTAAQIFPGNPKGWRHVALAAERAAALRQGWGAIGVAPLTIHAPYIINLASPDEAIYILSRQAILNALTRGAELGAPFVVVHLGSHKGSGPAAGAARLIAAATAALEGLPDWLFLLLENNVGAGNTMGGTLEALGGLVRDAAHPRIGVCIDTAHLWGAGYDLRAAEGVERAIDEIDRHIGMQHVRVLHVNDSPVPLGSRRDQHTHLGQGEIGYEGLAAVLTHPGLASVPAILETPDGGVEEEVIRLRAAALLCLGDAEGARALQEEALPPRSSGAPTDAGAEDGAGTGSPTSD